MKQFKNIYLEITDECGLKCPFCPSKDIIKKGSLDINIIKQRLNKIKDYTKQVYLHILGDPLVYHYIYQIFDYCDNNNINICITTNAAFINRLTTIPKCLKKINISLQSIITSNDIDTRLNKIINFLKLRNDTLGVSLRLWNDKSNDEIIKFNNLIQTKMNELLKDINQKNISWSYEDEFKWPNILDNINNIETSCLGGKNQLGILLNGDVVLCCLDYLGHTKIGNIDIDTLDNILNSDIYKEVLLGWNNRKPYFELCQKCTFRNKFKK